MSLKETVFFYTRNDYLIINSLLCDRDEQLLPIIEIVNEDSKAVLKEAEEGARELADEYKEMYENRIFDELDEQVIRQKKLIALNDIENIYQAMVDSEGSITLNRTIWLDRIKDTFCDHQEGDLLELRNISSASITLYREDEGRDFYRYEIKVNKGQKILELDQFEPFVRNEEGEVILPPMSARITKIKEDRNPNCLGVICIECVEQKFNTFEV